MNTHWKLFYNTKEEREEALSKYKEKVEYLNSLSEALFESTTEWEKKVETYLNEKNALEDLSAIGMDTRLALSCDSENAELKKFLSRYEEEEAKKSLHESRFSAFLNRIEDLENKLSTPVLKAHRYFILKTKENFSHTLSENEEKLLSLTETFASNMWEKMWEELTSNLEGEYEGKSINLSSLRALAYSKDKDTRKSAYEAELESYKKIEVPASYCLNAIKKQVSKVSKLRGYSSVLHLTCKDSRISPKCLDAMFGTLDKNIDEIREYFTLKAQMLGYDNALPFYELFAPVSKTPLSFTLEEAKDTVLAAFYAYSKKLGDFAENSFKNSHLDLLPRKGKVGGGFCETIHLFKQSRILINFEGSFNDVLTIAHELGHAYHSYLLKDDTPLNADYPMPIAETASNFCEALVIDYCLKGADKEKGKEVLENELLSATQSLVDIYSRFIFEKNVIEESEKGFLSSKELSNIMVEAQKTTYGSALSSYHEYMWICKPHYYDAKYNYYNFPYAFGYLLSRVLFAKYKEDKAAFLPLYDNIFSLTGTNDIKDVLYIANIDIEKEYFWQKGIDEILLNIKRLRETL